MTAALCIDSPVNPGLWDQILSAPYISKQQFYAANLLLLCQIAVNNGANPDMSTCTVEGLWDQVKGNPPFISDQQFYAENLNLLCQIAGGGGGGGGSIWIYWENANVSDAPPFDPTIAVERRFRDGSPPVTWDPGLQLWM